MLVNLRAEVDERAGSTNFTIFLCPIYYYTINFSLSGTSVSIYLSFRFYQMVYLGMLLKSTAGLIPDLSLAIYGFSRRKVCQFGGVKLSSDYLVRHCAAPFHTFLCSSFHP
jgi:hypothetical protein